MKQKTETLYYLTAYSRLSESRDRVSGYSSDKSLIEELKAHYLEKKPKDRLYLNLRVSSIGSNKLMKEQYR